MPHNKQKTISRFSGVYSRNELATYFDSLDKELKVASATLHHRIDITLSAGDHFALVTYHPKNQTWEVNENKVSPTRDTGKTIANHIALAFGLKDNFFGVKNAIVLESTIDVCAREKHKAKLYIDIWKMLPQWIDLHKVTAAKANLKDPLKHTWLDAAIAMGQPDVAQELIHKMKFYKKNPKLLAFHSTLITLYVAGAAANFAYGNVIAGSLFLALVFANYSIMELEFSRADKKRIIEAVNSQRIFTDLNDHSEELTSYVRMLKEQLKQSETPLISIHKKSPTDDVIVKNDTFITSTEKTVTQTESQDHEVVAVSPRVKSN